MPKLLVELELPVSNRLESEVRRLRPSMRDRATKRAIVEAALEEFFRLPEEDRGKSIRGELVASVKALATDNPVSTRDAAQLLNVSVSTITLIKRELGITRQRVFMDEIRAFLRANPGWNTRSATPTARPRKQAATPGPA